MMSELDTVRAELTRQHKIRRETQWRSTAYRAGVRIIELKARRKILRQQAI